MAGTPPVARPETQTGKPTFASAFSAYLQDARRPSLDGSDAIGDGRGGVPRAALTPHLDTRDMRAAPPQAFSTHGVWGRADLARSSSFGGATAGYAARVQAAHSIRYSGAAGYSNPFAADALSRSLGSGQWPPLDVVQALPTQPPTPAAAAESYETPQASEETPPLPPPTSPAAAGARQSGTSSAPLSRFSNAIAREGAPSLVPRQAMTRGVSLDGVSTEFGGGGSSSSTAISPPGVRHPVSEAVMELPVGGFRETPPNPSGHVRPFWKQSQDTIVIPRENPSGPSGLDLHAKMRRSGPGLGPGSLLVGATPGLFGGVANRRPTLEEAKSSPIPGREGVPSLLPDADDLRRLSMALRSFETASSAMDTDADMPMAEGSPLSLRNLGTPHHTAGTAVRRGPSESSSSDSSPEDAPAHASRWIGSTLQRMKEQWAKMHGTHLESEGHGGGITEAHERYTDMWLGPEGEFGAGI